VGCLPNSANQFLQKMSQPTWFRMHQVVSVVQKLSEERTLPDAQIGSGTLTGLRRCAVSNTPQKVPDPLILLYKC